MAPRALSAALLVLVLFAPSCATDVEWRRYRTSEYLEEQREFIARVRIRLDGIPLTDCRVCFNNPAWYQESCAKLDESGLVHKAAPRPYVWLKQLECRGDEGREIRRDFDFPYYASNVRAFNVTHYIGDVQIDLAANGGTIVSIKDDLDGF